MMDLLSTIAVVIPCVLSLCVSLIHAYIDLKKAKEPPKDEIWETAAKLVSASQTGGGAADDFAEIYMELKFFKDNGYSLNGEHSIHAAMQSKQRKQ